MARYLYKVTDLDGNVIMQNVWLRDVVDYTNRSHTMITKYSQINEPVDGLYISREKEKSTYKRNTGYYCQVCGHRKTNTPMERIDATRGVIKICSEDCYIKYAKRMGGDYK